MKMRAQFITEVLLQVGSPYRYGGKGESVPALDMRGLAWPWPVVLPRYFDCSGLVTWGWLRATGQDWRPDGHCDVLLARCAKVDRPRNGTLVFYGKKADASAGARQDAQHVVMYLDGCVVGANGGDSSTLTLKRAFEQSARVGLKPSTSYRPDVLGYYELPFPDEVKAPAK